MTAVSLRSPVVFLGLALVLTGCAGTDGPPATAQAAAPDSASPSERSPAPSAAAGRRIEVDVTGGEASGDTGRVPVALGDQVTLVVTGDVADEVHVHGYDLTAPLAPGSPAELPFAATAPGVFEVELHESGTVLLTLQVG